MINEGLETKFTTIIKKDKINKENFLVRIPNLDLVCNVIKISECVYYGVLCGTSMESLHAPKDVVFKWCENILEERRGGVPFE